MTNVSRVGLFWAAFVLTRPLGATVGDLIDKPEALGGFAFSRFYASLLLLVAVIALIGITRPKAGAHPRGARCLKRLQERQQDGVEQAAAAPARYDSVVVTCASLSAVGSSLRALLISVERIRAEDRRREFLGAHARYAEQAVRQILETSDAYGRFRTA